MVTRKLTENKPFTVLGAAVTVIVVLAAVIIPIVLYGDLTTTQEVQLIVMLFGIAGTTIPTILNLAKTEEVKQEQEKVRDELANGHYAETLREALTNHPNVTITGKDEHNGR